MYKALRPTAKRNCACLQLIELTIICKDTVTEEIAVRKIADLREKLIGSSLNDVVRIMADSIEFDTFARGRVNGTRRDMILFDININYWHLANVTGTKGGLLFGDNIEGAVRLVEPANRQFKKYSALAD